MTAGHARIDGGGVRSALIFAYECAPYHAPEMTVGAQRPAQFAKYLPEHGWRAIVLCCHRDERRAGWSERVAERVRRAVREANAAESIVIPIPSAPHDGLIDRLWLETLGGGDGGGRLRAAARKPLTLAKLATGDHSQSWQPCARRAAEIIASEVRVDACVGEYGPNAGLFLGRWFSDRYGVPWIADFRDPVLEPLPPIARGVYLPMLRRMLASAASLVAVNEHLAALDERLLGRPSAVISNGFDPDDFVTELPRDPLPAFTIAYTGTIHRSMRPDLFFEGLRVMRELVGDEGFARVRFAYRGVGAALVAEYAAAAGLSSTLDARPHVPRAEAIELVRRAHVLLLLTVTGALQRDAFYARGLHPGKTFDYLGARRPIIAVPGDGGLLDELLAETRAGVVLRTPREIGEYLASSFGAWRVGRPLPHDPDDAAIALRSRRALAGRLAELLEAASGAPAPPPPRRSLASQPAR
jgi:glycosyltransferase involved in cell wall biosynthesis